MALVNFITENQGMYSTNTFLSMPLWYYRPCLGLLLSSNPLFWYFLFQSVYLNQSLKAYEGTENLPYSLNYIGRVYTRRKEYDMALKTHKEAFEISKKPHHTWLKVVRLICCTPGSPGASDSLFLEDLSGIPYTKCPPLLQGNQNTPCSNRGKTGK